MVYKCYHAQNMGERLPSVGAGPVSKKPSRKGFWPMLGLAGSLAVTAPAPAEAGQDFNWGQFAQGAVNGYVRSQREQEVQERCLRTQRDLANERLAIARNDFRTDTAQAMVDADRALLALRNRTDLTSDEKDLERRSIKIELDDALFEAQSRLATARRIADERVRSCTPRRW